MVNKPDFLNREDNGPDRVNGQENGEMYRGSNQLNGRSDGEVRGVQNRGMNGGSSQRRDGVANEERDYVQKVVLCVASYYWILVFLMYFFPITHRPIFTLFVSFLSNADWNDWNGFFTGFFKMRMYAFMLLGRNAYDFVFFLNIHPIQGVLIMISVTLSFLPLMPLVL